MKNSSKVAIIGLGNIGKTVAQILVKGDRSVILASKNKEDAEALARELGSLATASDTGEAIKNADILIFGVWYNTLQELIGQYGEALSGKIIIDPTNPIAPDVNGGFKKIIGEKESAGQLNAQILPIGATLVKAFGTLGVASLASAAFQAPEKAVLFFATNEESVVAEVEELIEDAGFEAVKVGGLDQSIRIEVFGDLHEFGSLGKVVSKAEAIEKL